MRIYVCLFFSLCFGKQLFSQIIGANITYKHVANSMYAIEVSCFRKCNSASIGIPRLYVLADSTKDTISFALSRIAIKTLPTHCKTAAKPCDQQNEFSANGGVEEHFFTTNIEFDSIFKNKKNCKYILGIGNFKRWSKINTGAANTNFWVTSVLNTCIGKNNSPIFTIPPVVEWNINLPVYNTLGAIDTIDYDSLSYEWVDPQISFEQSIPWKMNFSKSQFLRPYQPGGTSFIRPDANPPLGLYLNPINSDIVFTPTNLDTSLYCIKIKEWRLQNNGTYKLIGEVNREFQFLINGTFDNIAPTLKGNFNINTCLQNQVYLNFETDDKLYIPPPPKLSKAPDTTILSWNGAIAGAIFKTRDTLGRLSKAILDYQVKEKDYKRNLFATISVSDQFCPKPIVQSKAIQIYVQAFAKTKVEIRQISCNTFEVKSMQNAKNNLKFQWHVLDSFGNIMNIDHKLFNNNSNTSVKSIDTFSINYVGKFIVKHGFGFYRHCTSYYFDTIIIKNLPQIKFNSDTLCNISQYKVVANVITNNLSYKLNWNYTGQIQKDTTLILEFKPLSQSTQIKATLVDSNKCMVWHYGIIVLAKPKINIFPKYELCFGDTAKIKSYH